MMWRIFYIFILKNSFYCVTLRLHFLFHFFVIGCGVLVARIVCNALRGGCILQYPGQFIGNFKIGVRIQMTIGSQGCLYFFMSQALFEQQGILSHADEQEGMGMPQRMDFNAVYAGKLGKFFQCPWQGMLAGGYAVVA